MHMHIHHEYNFLFFFNITATSEIYTLSLHDALPIWMASCASGGNAKIRPSCRSGSIKRRFLMDRSEEHTSELQSHHDLVCRLLLEKKNKTSERPLKHIHANYYYSTNN